jgi:uncharacterized membrane protein
MMEKQKVPSPSPLPSLDSPFYFIYMLRNILETVRRKQAWRFFVIDGVAVGLSPLPSHLALKLAIPYQEITWVVVVTVG